MCIFVVLKFAEFKFVLDQQTTYYQDFCFTYISLSYLRKKPQYQHLQTKCDSEEFHFKCEALGIFNPIYLTF